MVHDPSEDDDDPGEESPSREPPPDDDTLTLVRALLGGAVEGVDAVIGRLRPCPEAEDPDTTGNDRVRHALIGLLFDSYGIARKGVSTAGNIASFGWSLVEPVAGPLLSPVRRPAEALVDRWVRIGRREEEQGREAAREITRVPVDDLVAYLRENPEMEALVKRQAETLLAQLRDDPQVGSLVQSQGDRYLEHLRENPQGIQELVQGQSVGMVNEFLDVVRESAVVVDSFLERSVRATLRRRPRSRLPGPPPEVRVLAWNPRLKTDE